MSDQHTKYIKALDQIDLIRSGFGGNERKIVIAIAEVVAFLIDKKTTVLNHQLDAATEMLENSAKKGRTAIAMLNQIAEELCIDDTKAFMDDPWKALLDELRLTIANNSQNRLKCEEFGGQLDKIRNLLSGKNSDEYNVQEIKRIIQGAR